MDSKHPFARKMVPPRNSPQTSFSLFLLLTLLSYATSQTLPESCTPACLYFQDYSPFTILSAADCLCLTQASLEACSACYATLNPSFAESVAGVLTACISAESAPPPSGATPQAPQQPKCGNVSGPLTIPILQQVVATPTPPTTTSSTQSISTPSTTTKPPSPTTSTTSTPPSTSSTTTTPTTSTISTPSTSSSSSSSTSSTSTSVPKTLATSTTEAVTTVPTSTTTPTSTLVTVSRSIATTIQPWMGSQVFTAVFMAGVAMLFVFFI